jgi:purine-binding chemotaxis protein CheW
MQLVTFALGQENFGLDIMNVQEIIRTPAITSVPQAPPYVEGVTNLRGSILPVIDTRTKFGMPRTGRDASSRVIVVDVGGRTVGLSVDAVSEVLRVETASIEHTQAVSQADGGAIKGVVKVADGRRLVMILEAARVCDIEVHARGGGVEVRRPAEARESSRDSQGDEAQLVSFLLGAEEFAIDISHVREIVRFPEVVKVPNSPPYMRGVICLRDRLLPIIDLRIKLNTGSQDITDHTRVVVVDVHGTYMGLVVDRVYEVTRIARNTIFPPPAALVGEGRSQLAGIARLEGGKRILMLIDPQQVVSVDELSGLSEMEKSAGVTAGEETSRSGEGEEEQMVVFKLADEQYGIRITQVQEINRLSKITKVPRAPRFVEGVVNLRGDVIPVIDLRKRFDMPSKEYTEFTRIIVSDLHSKKIGIIVDEVLEVLRIPSHLVEPAPEILNGHAAGRFMDGIANLPQRMISMLDLGNVLVEREWQRLSEMGAATAEPALEAPAARKPARKR